jgi:16S rRNA (guanine(527)-N(7))-methyltransferase RsmG
MLRSEFRDLQLDVSSLSLQKLALYASEIEHWNKAVNLTALRGNALVRRLIVDPVWVGEHLQMDGSMADVGSGNGSPGLPLCITRQFVSTHLIEPRMRRAAFLRHVIAKLALTGVAVDRCRLEEMPVKALSAEWITLQAIDPTPDLIEALQRIATSTTRVVWITSVGTPPVSGAEKLEIPGGTTKIWVFRLDQI